MKIIYAVLDEDSDVTNPLYESKQDAKDAVVAQAKREWDYMQSNPDRYGLEGDMVDRWTSSDVAEVYQFTDEGHVSRLGKWSRIIMEWIVKPMELQ